MDEADYHYIDEYQLAEISGHQSNKLVIEMDPKDGAVKVTSNGKTDQKEIKVLKTREPLLNT